MNSETKKIIIITGTSTGIGFTLAEFFGKKGHKVFGLSRKNVDSKFFTAIPTDITDNAQVQNAISKILETEKESISSSTTPEWEWLVRWKILRRKRF
jgi:hypothetical protein